MCGSTTVEAGAVEGQRVEVELQRHRSARRAAGFGRPPFRRGALVARHPAVRHAVAAQRIGLRQAELQRVEAEQVGHGLVQVLLFPVEQVAPAGVASQEAKPIIRSLCAMDLIALPAFTDNYIWMLHDGTDAVVVDPGDAAPVLATLDARQLALAAILVTHHHGDHVGGVDALRPRLKGAGLRPARRGIPEPFVALADGDTSQLLGLSFG